MSDAILIKLILIIVGLMITGGLIMAIGAVIGGWLMFKGRSQTGESFLSAQTPKGEVFTIPESAGAPNFPGEEEPTEHEKKILERTAEFLGRLNNKDASL